MYIKYRNLKGNALEFLNQLVYLIKQYFGANEIKDPHARSVAADCLNEFIRHLMD